MLPYKAIDIPHYPEIQSQLLGLLHQTITDFTSTNTKTIDYHLVKNNCPGLIEFLDANNLIWDVGRFFVTPPHDGLYIHVDGNSERSRILSLNLPLLNCEHSEMIWWDNVEIVDLRSHESYGNNIAKMDSENKIKIGSLALTSPHLVKVDIPHSVENHQDKLRAIFSMRFKPEPYHLWY
jgi:hypothetical protein